MENLRVPPRDTGGEMLEDMFKQFLKSYRYEGDWSALTLQQSLSVNYMEQLQTMIQNNKSTLYVNFSHINECDAELAEAIELEYYRFDPYLRHALQQLIYEVDPSYVIDLDKGQREFFVSFYNFPRIERIRAMNTDKVGRLLCISGTVTRSTEVRPELMYGHFLCKKCGAAHPAVEQQFQYTEPQICKNPQCKSVGDFQILMEKSVFVDWQRLRVQENADEIPPGSMPRCVDVICRNEIVESAKAGDKIVITGTVVVVPDTGGLARLGEAPVGGKVGGRGDGSGYGDSFGGLKKLGVKEMTYRMIFVAASVQHADSRSGVSKTGQSTGPAASGVGVGADPALSTFVIPTADAEDADYDNPDAAMDLSEGEKEEIFRMHAEGNIYHRMVESICPSVFGHMEVKRGVLLMLFGGVHKKTPEGISLRGDLNVCIVGDPSCAKSQFLKYVHGFLPRTVYTSGKSSSAAGLTASVVRDAETGEFCVEAGALMLADNGICCIDEFDKMDPHDQVAIHEAMEQQTISITKAGIQATLNARTSILAAANPVFGRYDRTKTLKANIAVSAAIMSRFDLFFVILDECNPTIDESIARHIVGVHKEGGLERASKDVPFTREQIQRYIRFARTINPIISPEAAPVLVECFRMLRSNDLLGKNKTAYRITVRQLESLVRLSEALARLHLDEHVQPIYIREAFRLLQKSIILVENEDIELEDIEEEMDQLAHRNRIEGSANRRGRGEEGEDMDTAEEVDPEGGGGYLREGNVEGYLERMVPAVQGSQGDGEGQGTVDEGEAKLPTDEPKVVRKIKKAKVTISAEEYDQIRELLKLILRHDEEGKDLTYPGMLWRDLRNAYLEKMEAQISGPEELETRRKIVELVMRRLMKTDYGLMEVPPTDAANDDKYLKWSPLDP